MNNEKKARALSYVAREFPTTAKTMRLLSKDVGAYENTQRAAYTADNGKLFIFAVSSGDAPRVAEALALGLPEPIVKQGLLQAIRMGNEAVVGALLPRITNVNFTLYGKTPLLEAVDRYSAPVAKLLLDAGADPNQGIEVRRVFGPPTIQTPLSIALLNSLNYGNTTDLVKHLINYGATVTQQTIDDWDSRYKHTVGLGQVSTFNKPDFAMRKKWQEISDMLVDAKTSVNVSGGRRQRSRSKSRRTRKARKAFKRNTYKRRTN